MHEAKRMPNTGGWQGAQLTLVIAGQWQHYRTRILKYLRQIAVITPYLRSTFKYTASGGDAASAVEITFKRRSEKMPTPPSVHTMLCCLSLTLLHHSVNVFAWWICEKIDKLRAAATNDQLHRDSTADEAPALVDTGGQVSPQQHGSGADQAVGGGHELCHPGQISGQGVLLHLSITGRSLPPPPPPPPTPPHPRARVLSCTHSDPAGIYREVPRAAAVRHADVAAYISYVHMSQEEEARGAAGGTERLVGELRSGVDADTDPGHLTVKQVTRLHQLMHEAKFRDPSGSHLSPAGAPANSFPSARIVMDALALPSHRLRISINWHANQSAEIICPYVAPGGIRKGGETRSTKISRTLDPARVDDKRPVIHC